MRSAILYLLLCVPAPAARTVELHYKLEPRPNSSQSLLHVEVAVKGLQQPYNAALIVPSSWGNASNLAKAVRNLAAHTPGQRIVDSPDPDRKQVQGYTKGPLVYSYDVVNDWEGPMRESVRHRPHVETAYIEVNARNAFVLPDIGDSQPVQCTFEWKLPPGWTLATSFGTAPRQKFQGDWDKMRNAVFVAGDFRLLQSRLGKGQLVLAIRGAWKHEPEITAQIQKIIPIVREFWRDDDFPYYLVTIVPMEHSGSGGGGFTNAVSLHFSTEARADRGLLELMAHEVFHSWNPYRVGRLSGPAEAIYWFTEGFTTYYAGLLLHRAGAITQTEYLDSVNRIIRDYALSPAKAASTNQLIEWARKGEPKNGISYERGALAALWLDTAIRRRSAGRASLDSVMLDLFHEVRSSKRSVPRLDTDRVLQTVSRYLPPEEVKRIRDTVESGALLDPPADAFLPFAKQTKREMFSFELGMDRTALVERHVVEQLAAGSAAERAGLREGDRINAMSIYWNDTSKPVKLGIRRGGASLRIEYFPTGPSLGQVPQYIPASAP